jgi:uncharacterized protein (DUF1697 family)
MTAYVALLRGINVGRNKQIPMADLRKLLEGLGYGDVRTHLRSGNAVFTAPQARAAAMADEISAAIDRELGMSVGCVVRTGAQLRAVVDGNPLADVATDPAKYLVAFLSAPVDKERLATLDAEKYAPERYELGRQEIYLWLPNGVYQAKLAKGPWEKQPGLIVTARNWSTVTKLLAMTEA